MRGKSGLFPFVSRCLPPVLLLLLLLLLLLTAHGREASPTVPHMSWPTAATPPARGGGGGGGGVTGAPSCPAARAPARVRSASAAPGAADAPEERWEGRDNPSIVVGSDAELIRVPVLCLRPTQLAVGAYSVGLKAAKVARKRAAGGEGALDAWLRAHPVPCVRGPAPSAPSPLAATAGAAAAAAGAGAAGMRAVGAEAGAGAAWATGGGASPASGPQRQGAEAGAGAEGAATAAGAGPLAATAATAAAAAAACPAGPLYLIDHHHLASALHRLGVEDCYAAVVRDYSSPPADAAADGGAPPAAAAASAGAPPAAAAAADAPSGAAAAAPSAGPEHPAFWAAMRHDGCLWPHDERGEPVDWADLPSRLPSSVAGLRDDPYRSLAGLVRRAGGFEKSGRPFAEFVWANHLRTRVRLPAPGAAGAQASPPGGGGQGEGCDGSEAGGGGGELDLSAFVPAALEHAGDRDAEGLPGFSLPPGGDAA